MAIFKTGAVVAGISGKVGGSVFVQSSRGNVIRATPKQTRADTQAQLRQRARLVSWNYRWRTLTNNQRAAWRTAARNRPMPNRLGVMRQISGFNFYVYCNSVYESLSFATLTLPPRLETSISYAISSFTYAVVPPGTLTLTRNGSEIALFNKFQMQVRPSAALGPLSDRWTPVRADLVGPWTNLFYAEILTVLGAFVSGTVYWVRYQTCVEGYLPGGWRSASVTIP